MTALALAISHGSAKAAVPVADTINEVTKPSTMWTGFFALGETSDPTLCTPGDQGVVCDTFKLTTQTAGPVQAVVTWDPSGGADLDLLVCLDTVVDTSMDNCTGGDQVAFSSSQNDGFEIVTWSADAGQTYDIRVIPFFAIAQDYQGCASYTDVTTTCQAPNGGGSSGGTTASSTCPTNTATQTVSRSLNGGGDIADGSGNMKQHFAFQAMHKLDGNQNRTDGKLNYKNDDTFQFKSTQIQCVTFYDEGTDANGHPKGSAEMRGVGKLRNNGASNDTTVCFRAFARDNGEPGGTQNGGSDQFNFEYVPVSYNTSGNAVCTFQSALPANFQGQLITTGNVDYKTSAS